MKHYPEFALAFAKFLTQVEGAKVSVIGHQRPDGDCIGSQVALCRMLRARGIDAIAVNPDPVPRRVKFLLDDTPFFRRDAADHDGRQAVFVDCADHDRSGEKMRNIYPAPLACFDHHLSNNGFARFNFVDPSTAATAELLAGLFLDSGMAIDAVTAQALYVGIMTDTGQFRFASTSQRVFRIAAELLGSGANAAEAGRELYENESPGKLKLLQRFLESLKLECGGRVCIGLLPDGVFDQTGASVEDTEGLVDYARSIDGVEIGVLIELRPGVVKASLRAKHAAYRMDLVAGEFGGGGHASAAGLNTKGEFKDFHPRLLESLGRRIKEIDSISPK